MSRRDQCEIVRPINGLPAICVSVDIGLLYVCTGLDSTLSLIMLKVPRLLYNNEYLNKIQNTVFVTSQVSMSKSRIIETQANFKVVWFQRIYMVYLLSRYKAIN